MMIIYNNKQSYLVFDERQIPVGSIAFDSENNKIYVKNSESGELINISTPDLITEYEITNFPEGTTVEYLENRIKINAENAAFQLQQVGATGNPNMNYCALKIYAPSSEIMSFKEGDRGTVKDEINYFENNSFAGIDANGRKYSIVWLALASYNASTETWTYFGANSTKEKFIGWDYIVEWYDKDNKLVSTSATRIDLTNAICEA